MQAAQTFGASRTASGHAPGRPGIDPTWSGSAKDLIGCALGPSRLWFTVGHGIINEIYYPRIDIPQIRDLGFIVADNAGFWVEVKRLQAYTVTLGTPGTPAAAIVHRHPRFELRLRIVPDPQRDVLLVALDLDGDAPLRPYALLAPHVGGTGHGNSAAVETYRGRRVLWASQGPFGLALAAADHRQGDAWRRASAGYVGVSDGWQDFHRHGVTSWEYKRAGAGNVALMGELPRQAVLALGLGSSKESAATLAISALLQPVDLPWQQQVADWTSWHTACAERYRLPEDLPSSLHEVFMTSAMVLRAHQDKTYPGAMVASLSIPWGQSKDERGGYHLVWPRDLVECAGALLALGADDEARNILRYLIASQHGDGHWYQNQWLGGKPYWHGIQLDEAAFPVLLAATLGERGALDGIEVQDMVRRALGFIACTGPASDQDRWEEDAGVNTFTLAVCIAALVAGAPFLDPPARDTALALADYWNERIEGWTAARDTPLARRLGISGYYIRVAPVQAISDSAHGLSRVLPIKNRSHDPRLHADEQIGVDFLQLVRFGLRSADDPLIRDTLTVADTLLKADTPAGAAWHRYTGDGYGEHDDGRPFDGTGRGRAWPLLTGERGHFELAAGHDPLPYLETMAAMAGANGMLPEQVWDAPPIPARGLYPGRPTGSAMPLAWAHAEFIKLIISRRLGRPFDRPTAVWERYHGRRPQGTWAFWCQHAPIDTIRPGARLRVCLHRAGSVHWGVDGWQSLRDTLTCDSGLQLHVAEIDSAGLQPGQRIDFTFRDGASGRWAGVDYSVRVIKPIR